MFVRISNKKHNIRLIFKREIERELDYLFNLLKANIPIARTEVAIPKSRIARFFLVHVLF